MQSRSIDDLPYRTLRQLSKVLDSPQRGWQSLIELLPHDFYSVADVEKFQLLYMRLDTSPAYNLLVDMGKRGVTVNELRGYLENMDLLQAVAILGESPPYQETRMPTYLTPDHSPHTSNCKLNEEQIFDPRYKEMSDPPTMMSYK